MPKVYVAGDQLLASEYNEVIKLAGGYAASSGGTDTYAFTMTVVPGSYATGDIYHVKFDVANTGAATGNVNSLGAKSILRADGSALADGDIAAGMFAVLQYDGSALRIISALANSPIYKVGTTTYNVATANGTQTIAHGLGRIPRKIKLTLLREIAIGSPPEIVFATYNGVTAAVVGQAYVNNDEGYVGTTIICGYTTNNTVFTTGTITFDATNINIAWVKTGSPTGIMQMLWEAEA